MIPGFIAFAHDTIDEFYEGESILLRWSSHGVSELNAFISYDHGNTWQLIGSKIIAALGQFEYQLSDISVPMVLFMIQDSTDQSIMAISNFVTIKKGVLLQLDGEEIQKLLAGKVITTFHPATKQISLQIEEEDKVRIIALECPHNGCTVEFITATQKHECPCHGSAFSRLGCLLRGPAEIDLKCYQGELDLDSQIIKINLTSLEGIC